MNKLSIVIPALLNAQPLFKMTKDLLDGLFFYTKGIEHCEIILVDDGSDTRFVKFLPRFFPKLKIVRNDVNMGFAHSINNGIANSSCDNILLLNNDVKILDSNWLKNFLNGVDSFNFDVASVKQSMLDERFEYILDSNRGKYNKEKCFCYPVGWLLFVKRAVFEKVGVLPTDFGVGFWEDTAWAYEVKNKYPEFKIGIVDGIYKVQIDHLEHTTFKTENIDIAKQYKENRKIFLDAICGRKELNLPQLKKKKTL